MFTFHVTFLFVATRAVVAQWVVSGSSASRQRAVSGSSAGRQRIINGSAAGRQ